MVNQMVCKKMYLSWVYCVGIENPSLGNTVRHHAASLRMPISVPRHRFFYPHHTPMKNTYIRMGVIIVQISFGEVNRRFHDRKSRFTAPPARRHRTDFAGI